MKLEYETKSACRIMVDLLSDEWIVQLILYKRNEFIAAGFFSFNTKSIISRHMRLLPSAPAMMTSIQRCTMINVGKWMNTVVSWHTIFGVCVGDWACACNLYRALFWPSPLPNFEILGTRLIRDLICSSEKPSNLKTNTF